MRENEDHKVEDLIVYDEGLQACLVWDNGTSAHETILIYGENCTLRTTPAGCGSHCHIGADDWLHI